MFNTPGRAVAVHPGSGRALVAFIFRRPEVAGFDHTVALRRFEARHRVLVEPKLRNLGGASQLLVPSTGWGIAARNLLTRTWPLAAAADRRNRALRG